LFRLIALNTENESTMKKIIDVNTKKPEIIVEMCEFNGVLLGNNDLKKMIMDYALRKNIPAVTKAFANLSGGISRIFRR